jgi:hypothetical protein
MLLQADLEALATREVTTHKPGICLLTETYYPVVGGGETQARVLAEDLVARGFKVTVVTRRSSKALSKLEQIGGVTVCRTSPVGGGHLKRWAMVFTCLPVLLIRSRQYDLIYVSGFKALGLTAVMVSRLLRKPCVLKADSNGEPSSIEVGKFLAWPPIPRCFDCFSGCGTASCGERTTSWPYRRILPRSCIGTGSSLKQSSGLPTA